VEGEEKRGRECSKETLEKTNNNYQSPWLRQFSYGRAVKFSPPTIIMIEDKEREGERRRERE
jgi:fructose-bisphosphate aldolase class 1